MKGVPLTDPAQPALNFIGDQNRAGFRRDLASAPIKLFGDRTYAAFALDGFEDDRADVIGKLPLQILDAVELDELKSRHQRFEGFAILLLPGCGKGAERPAMT